MLTDAAIRRVKPTEKVIKLVDGGGLTLLVNPNGSRLWRVDYRFQSRRQQLSLGRYPEVSLATARELAAQVREKALSGADPSLERKRERSLRVEHHQQGKAPPGSLEAVAREWLAKLPARDLSQETIRNKTRRLEKYVFPYLGRTPIASLTTQDLLIPLLKLDGVGSGEIAHRTKNILSEVFHFAAGRGLVSSDPTSLMRNELSPIKKGRHPALLEPAELATFLRAAKAYRGHNLVVKTALQLQPMLFVRPGDLRWMEWHEIDIDGERPRWTIPGWKLKGHQRTAALRDDLVIHLPRQAVQWLKELEPHTRPRSTYVFPGARSTERKMSENAVNTALRSMGYDKDTLTGHGFRATARTILREVLKWDKDVIEVQLAHALPDPNKGAYSREKFLDERGKMLQAWADYLDELVGCTNTVPRPR
jgi:integrase